MSDEIDLNFLARQIERVLSQLGSLRDEQRIQFAILQRLDHTMTSLVDEMRAVHRQIARMNDRVQKLEDQP